MDEKACEQSSYLPLLLLLLLLLDEVLMASEGSGRGRCAVARLWAGCTEAQGWLTERRLLCHVMDLVLWAVPDRARR